MITWKDEIKQGKSEKSIEQKKLVKQLIKDSKAETAISADSV